MPLPAVTLLRDRRRSCSYLCRARAGDGDTAACTDRAFDLDPVIEAVAGVAAHAADEDVAAAGSHAAVEQDAQNFCCRTTPVPVMVTFAAAGRHAASEMPSLHRLYRARAGDGDAATRTDRAFGIDPIIVAVAGVAAVPVMVTLPVLPAVTLLSR